MKQITLLVILITLLLAACTDENTLVDNEYLQRTFAGFGRVKR